MLAWSGRDEWRERASTPLAQLRQRSGAEALDAPLRAFPSWFLRIVCERCGKERLIAETHMPQGDASIRDILSRMHHDGCDGRAGKAELITGVEGVSSRPVRRIVPREG